MRFCDGRGNEVSELVFEDGRMHGPTECRGIFGGIIGRQISGRHFWPTEATFKEIKRNKKTKARWKVGELALYIMFASKHSTSSLSIMSPSLLLPILIAATNSSKGILDLRTFSPPCPTINPPAMKTFLKRFLSAMSRPRSRVR